MTSTIFNTPSIIHITCPNRIVPYLEAEVKALGFNVQGQSMAGIELTGTVEDCIKLNLHIRTGHRVLYLLKKVKSGRPEALYQEVYKIAWENYISKDTYFSIVSHVENESINNSTFASLKCKDAIADRFMNLFKTRPDSGPLKNKAVIFLHWKNDEASIYLDTSGEALSKHGYRKMPHKAPLQETLSAALILASRWDGKANFVNPMCGSGTLAIEAALIATHRPPGLYRNNYGFMHLLGYQEEVYKTIRQEMKSMIVKSEAKIIASDLDPDAIAAAKQNAATAGVDHLIEFRTGDFRDEIVPEGGGVVFLNPEYGERLGDEAKLEEVYKQIGDFFKQKCKGYTGYIFTGNFQLAKKIGLKTKRKIEFYNSTIDCRLLEFELYEGTRRIKPQGEQV